MGNGINLIYAPLFGGGTATQRFDIWKSGTSGYLIRIWPPQSGQDHYTVGLVGDQGASDAAASDSNSGYVQIVPTGLDGGTGSTFQSVRVKIANAQGVTQATFYLTNVSDTPVAGPDGQSMITDQGYSLADAYAKTAWSTQAVVLIGDTPVILAARTIGGGGGTPAPMVGQIHPRLA